MKNAHVPPTLPFSVREEAMGRESTHILPTPPLPVRGEGREGGPGGEGWGGGGQAERHHPLPQRRGYARRAARSLVAPKLARRVGSDRRRQRLDRPLA